MTSPVELPPASVEARYRASEGDEGYHEVDDEMRECRGLALFRIIEWLWPRGFVFLASAVIVAGAIYVSLHPQVIH